METTTQMIQLMEDHLNQVWNERNEGIRSEAIERIYTSDVQLFHVADQVTGLDALNSSVSTTRQLLPKDFVFTLLQPVVINHNLGRLFWGAGAINTPPSVTGMDIALFENGKIKALYVFLDH